MAVSIAGFVDLNRVLNPSAPIFLITPDQTTIDIGDRNQFPTLGASVRDLTVDDSVDTITANAFYHSLTAGVNTDLDNIFGYDNQRDGAIVTMRRAAGSVGDITLTEVGNMTLAGTFLMDAEGDQIELVREGTDFLEISRASVA